MNIFKNKTVITIVFSFLCISVLLGSIISLGQLKLSTAQKNNISYKKTLGTQTQEQSLFYGENIDMSELLPTSPYYIKNDKGEDLIDLSHRLGITMLRISSVLQAFPSQTPDVIYTKDQWDTVLQKMNTYGMKAMIIAETHSTNKNIYTDAISDDFLTLVKAYIIDTGIGDNPAVYAFDMKNEPTLSDDNIVKLKQEAQMIKNRYPTMRVTIGGWKTDTGTKDSQGKPILNWNMPLDAKLFVDFVDILSPHIYNFDRKVNGLFPDPKAYVTDYLNQLEAVANNKPILIGEFGASNGDSVSDQKLIGSKQLQANTYYGVYNGLLTYSQKNILGSIGYVLYSRNLDPDSWAIVKDKGNYLYPASYVIQQTSLGTSQAAFTLPMAPVPDDIMLGSSNFKASQSAKIHDIVSISLPLNRSNTYVLRLTPSNGADTIQSLQFNAQVGMFSAVITPKIAGKLIIAIDQLPPCLIDKTCTQAPYYIYTTTLNVH